jgi:hypothetical protein
MRDFCPAAGLHSPCQVPLNGCPSWANATTVKKARAITAARRIITGSLQYISATPEQSLYDILIAIQLQINYSSLIRMYRFLVFLLAGSLAGQVVPLTVHGAVVVANVRLNGQGPFRMIVDTGASSCSVVPRVASLLQLRAEYRVLDVTSVDKRWIPGGKSLEVSLGTRIAGNVESLWQESRGLAEAGLVVDGVLGQSFPVEIRLPAGL